MDAAHSEAAAKLHQQDPALPLSPKRVQALHGGAHTFFRAIHIHLLRLLQPLQREPLRALHRPLLRRTQAKRWHQEHDFVVPQDQEHRFSGAGNREAALNPHPNELYDFSKPVHNIADKIQASDAPLQHAAKPRFGEREYGCWGEFQVPQFLWKLHSNVQRNGQWSSRHEQYIPALRRIQSVIRRSLLRAINIGNSAVALKHTTWCCGVWYKTESIDYPFH